VAAGHRRRTARTTAEARDGCGDAAAQAKPGFSGASRPRASAPARPGRGSGRGASGRGARSGPSARAGCRLRRRLLGPEDLLLGAAGEQGVELGLLDRLALDEDLGDRGQVLAVRGEDVPRLLVRGLDDAADLVVDLARDLVGVVRLGRELAAEERLTVVVAEDARGRGARSCRSA
jgi:hypothetical protein